MFDRLRKHAKAERRSLRYLCEAVGKSSSYINDTEKAGNCPPDNIVETWAAALHTTPGYLMGETDDPGEKKEPTGENASGLSDEDRELIEAFRAASPEKRQAILALLK